MKSLQKQHGLTLISWIVVLVIAIFCGMFAFRIVPMYTENTYIASGLKQLADEPTFAEMTDAEIKKNLANFFLINNVNSAGSKNIVIDRKSENLIVKIDYELRSNLFYNIDVITSFRNHLDSSRKSECCTPRDEK